MKKTVIFAALAASSLVASAHGTSQVASSGLANHGHINNTVRSSATVHGVGTSYSAATGEAGAASSGKAITSINTVPGMSRSGTTSVEGQSSAYTNGTAFNVSTGAGTGSASSTGVANADMVGSARYSGPGQWVNVSGNTVSHANGGVAATTNTGGFFSSATNGSFKVEGLVGSKVTTAGTTVTKEVVGSVKDTKTSVSSASTGTMTVDGRVLNQAPVNAAASTVVNARGAFGDPV